MGGRYGIGSYCNHNIPVDNLKEILRAYGISMTGNKEALLEKDAKLEAEH